MNELKQRLRERLSRTRNRHLFVLDAVALLLIPSLCLALRLEGEAIYPYRDALIAYTLVGLLVRLALFHPFRLYRRYWFYATVDELIHLTVAIATATAVAAVPFYLSGGYGLWGKPLPKSMPVLDGFATLLFLGGFRFSLRLANRYFQPGPGANAERVLLVGAGHAGHMVARDIQANPKLGMRVVGYLDDDPGKLHQAMGSLQVLAPLHKLPDVVARERVRQVIIAMPTAAGSVIRQVVKLCEQAHVPVRIMPLVHEIIEGKVTVNQLREVQVEDLLRRDEIRTDTEAVDLLVGGRRVLITGGGGSIGTELCRQILDRRPSRLLILGHGENSVFDSSNELKQRAARLAAEDGHHVEIETVIADIRFADRVSAIVRDFRPDIIFHAAAHKHVPLMEMNPSEAISNNVFGTRNLLRAADRHGVERFVMISTDKAVNPTSVMGASKRVAELLVLRAARARHRNYVCVRFGNVLGSRGSVVHTFREQISKGGPVTVSHEDMKRFFMTIPEAVQLVLQASVLGRGGEVFVLDMGEPVKIMDLARDMIELSGFEVGEDIEISISGIRPGEKLFEELFVDGEDYAPTRHRKVLIASNASSFIPASLDASLVQLEQAVAKDDHAGVVRRLLELLPEYTPDPRHGVSRQEVQIAAEPAGVAVAAG